MPKETQYLRVISDRKLTWNTHKLVTQPKDENLKKRSNKVYKGWHHGGHENHSNIGQGSLTESDTTTFTHTKRSKACYIESDTELNTHYTNA